MLVGFAETGDAGVRAEGEKRKRSGIFHLFHSGQATQSSPSPSSSSYYNNTTRLVLLGKKTICMRSETRVKVHYVVVGIWLGRR